MGDRTLDDDRSSFSHDGTPGRDPNPDAHRHIEMARCFRSSTVPACASREFVVWASGRSSPVVTWMRALPLTAGRRRSIDVSDDELRAAALDLVLDLFRTRLLPAAP